MKRHAWILTLGLTLLPPASSQSSADVGGVHLRPAPDSGGDALLVAEGLEPGQRALLVALQDPHPCLHPGAWRPGRRPTAGSPVVRAPRAVARADGRGRASFTIPELAFSAQPTLSVVVLGAGGAGGAVEWGSLTLPEVRPILRDSAGANDPFDPQVRVLVGQSRRVLVTEFMKDPVAVSDSRGEWIEVLNPSSTPVDLTGWILSDEGSDATVLTPGSGNLVVPPYGYLVLGRELDPALNGGVSVDATYSGMTLSNGADEIVLSEPNGWVADIVRYDDGVAWPDDAGASVSLSARAWFTRLDDRGVAWCPGETPMAGGDLGTPGAFNDTCGD